MTVRTQRGIRVGDRAPRYPRAGDIALVAVGGLILLLTIVVEPISILRPLRIVLGLAYIFVVPGYCLTVAFFPRSDDLDGVERIGLSLGLSVCAIVVLALILDRLPWGVTQGPIVGGLLVLTAAASAVALRRRRRSQVAAWTPPPSAVWRRLPPSERRVYVGLGAILLNAALLATWVFAVPSPDQFMTEFYVLGSGQLAERYPYQTEPGDSVAVTLGIVNREREASRYRVEVWVSDAVDPSRREQVTQLGPIELQPGESYAGPVGWTMSSVGEDQRVEIVLFRNGDEQPYRQLRTWINVGTS